MSHGLQNANDMVFTGAHPWHGLGVQLPTAPSIDDLLDNKALNWEVIKLRMGVLLRDDLESFELDEDAFQLRRQDTMVKLANVTKSYEPVQNKTALEFFRGLVESGFCTIETAGVLHGGQKMWVLAKMTSDPIEPIKGDEILPYFLFSHGHDGKTAVKITPTAIRVVCQNTLGWADQATEDYQVRIVHKTGVHTAIANIENIVLAAKQGIVETEELLKAMAGLPIDEDSLENFWRKSLRLPYRDPELLLQDEEAFEELMKKGARTMEAIREAYEMEAFSIPPSARGSVYHGYQALTNFTAHSRGGSDRGQRLGENWFGNGALIRDKGLAQAKKLVAS
jgi:phage/plasmid-like protein (TIGR03299 family)